MRNRSAPQPTITAAEIDAEWRRLQNESQSTGLIPESFPHGKNMSEMGTFMGLKGWSHIAQGCKRMEQAGKIRKVYGRHANGRLSNLWVIVKK